MHALRPLTWFIPIATYWMLKAGQDVHIFPLGQGTGKRAGFRASLFETSRLTLAIVYLLALLAYLFWNDLLNTPTAHKDIVI